MTMRTTIVTLAAMLLASGPALAGAGGVTLACKGTLMIDVSGASPMPQSGSVAIEPRQVHLSVAPYGPCPIKKVNPTSIEFDCPYDKEIYDRAGGVLNRISGDLLVLFEKGQPLTSGYVAASYNMVCSNAAPLF
jgi:hypothetical protein